ncbi:MAG: DUF2510 domain-containing protein [Actinomycetota bacterium]|nr:DUF2510 domain-containing protein [Acidimicrobiia bacterium]MDQ3468591.1 DUF2510 domain-containing protein [Actinomycetota bacterium]
MSSYPAGWYPDGSGRFAQRYYDGTAWTEHVLDTRGNRGTDPVGLGAPTQYRRAQQGEGRQFGAAQQTQGAADAWAERAAAGGPFVLSVGHVVTAIGATLVLLSLFVLDFLASDDQRAELGELGDASSETTGFLLDSYADAGRFLALLIIAAAVLAALRLPAFPKLSTTLPLISAIACAVLGCWHLAAMLANGEIDAGPTFDAFLGLVGYAALAAGPYGRRPLTA